MPRKPRNHASATYSVSLIEPDAKGFGLLLADCVEKLPVIGR